MDMRGRRIAFDYGDARTGVALCDPDGILASPLCVLESTSKDFFQQIEQLLTEHEPIRIFVGMPVNMSGSSGSRCVGPAARRTPWRCRRCRA